MDTLDPFFLEPEAPGRAFLHIDMDSFFVSVERLRDSRLLGKPVIVGGSSSRGVVSTCSYEARKFGVHSAMSMVRARQLCPQGIFLRGNMDAYTYYSRLITDIIREKAPAFEKASIDEFYLDLTGMDRFFGTQKWAWELRQLLMKESGLPISAGLSVNKIVCKIATSRAKPNGKLFIPAGQVNPFLDPQPVGNMPMVGRVTLQFLESMGVHTVGMLRQFSPAVLLRSLGKPGLELLRRAHGLDERPVEPYSENKSVSIEQTFSIDTADLPFLRQVILGMVEKLAFRMRDKDLMTCCVGVKIKYSDFQTETRQIKIAYTNRDDVLIESVMAAFTRCYSRRLWVRLVGVQFSQLVYGNYQMRLFDAGEKQAHLMLSLDKIRHRYGLYSVGRANGIFSENLRRLGRDERTMPSGSLLNLKYRKEEEGHDPES